MANNFVFEEEKLPTKYNFKVWKKIFKYALENWPLLIVLITSMLVTTFFDSSFLPLMNAAAIESLQFVIGENVKNLIIDVNLIFDISFHVTFYEYALIFFIAIIVRSLTIFITFFTTNYFDMLINTSLRRDSFRHIQELSFSYFDKTPSGWLIARVQNDTSTISDILSWGLIRIIWICFELVFTLITMFSRDVTLSLIILSTAPVLIILLPIFQRLLLNAQRKARSAYSNFVRWLAECINGVKTIKTLNIEDNMYQEAVGVTSNIFAKRQRSFRLHAYFMPSIMLVSSFTTALVILLITIRPDISYLQNRIGIATLVLFIGFIGQIYQPIQEFSEVANEFIATQASVEKVISLIETKPEIVDRLDVIEKYGSVFNNKRENFEKLHGDIIFQDVSFSYVEGATIIHNLNLQIKKGTSLAIVGETGSGKTTTVNLLCRFYEPTSGQILIDGKNYQERSVGWLRSNLGYVQQTPFVFRGSYFDNVKYGKLDATLEEVKRVCQIVGLHDFIMSQASGYHTLLDDGGSQLSGGQRQLLSFARALVREPSLLILDEATSSIDTESEALIQEALHKLLKGRTSIIIAHRLSTIVNTDRILVMEDGRIIEDGNHKTLMEKKGAYYHLYMNQFRELNLDEQIATFEEQITKKKIKL